MALCLKADHPGVRQADAPTLDDGTLSIVVMPWWMDLVLLVAGCVLWVVGDNHSDDVIGLLEKILASAAVMVVLLGGRWLFLELVALALALWLPSASRFEQGPRP
jgi:hypothetical protein